MKQQIIVKTQEQIEGIRKSCQLAAQTLDFITPRVQEGTSTEQLNQWIEEFIRSHRAIPATLGYSGFPKSCCISLNNVVCHGIPSPNDILKNGDILNIDVTTILDGYFGDTSRMFTVGEISPEAQKLIDTTKHCLDLGIEQVRPSNYFGNIGFFIGRYARSQGYSVVHEYTGHGVGIAFHEPPQVEHSMSHRNKGGKMQEGMIFTIEPMINQGKAKVTLDKQDQWTAWTIDGKLSAQWEHTLLVTSTGYEILTLSPQ